MSIIAHDAWETLAKKLEAERDQLATRCVELEGALTRAKLRFELIALGNSTEVANPKVGATDARQALNRLDGKEGG